jgi:serine/threonine protein kinase
MGEVYRARDTRLSRSVAIKVVSERFAARFEREAKTISALNHPHICTLHDIGSENGLDYLVMEYCEGQTLAERLERGPLAVEQVLQYGVEIADALSRAHRAGVIHRDLKPSNIMLTKSGLKLLDFGLAKQQGVTTDASDTTSLQGTIVGTIQYLSPEVLNGQEADARSDIFALGLVLYEMLSGKKAFPGTSKASVMASILEHEPPPVDTSPALKHVIEKCLAKDPDARWESAHDVAEELRWIRENKGVPLPSRHRAWLVISRIVILTAIAALLWRTRCVHRT